ncbi:MAG: DUF3987 domain-containing protein [Nitrospirae bacterium]|nr:DUF3987 domain-containing protein [Nitrospirota bacterium]MBI3393840.1 DUF3987 domain-containing protein [Nitrospirota bacterium]
MDAMSPIAAAEAAHAEMVARTREQARALGLQVVGHQEGLDGDSPATEMPWPDPPAAEVYHGLAGDIVRAIEPHTEADSVALLAQFLAAFGSVIGPSSRFIADGAEHGMKVFAVLVGVTSKGRKGTSWAHVRRIFQSVDEGWTGRRVSSGLSSGEGLIWQARDPIYKEIKGEKVCVDPGEDDKRFMVLEPEFARALRAMERDGSTLSAVIRDAWDTGDLRALTKNSPANATGAHISIVGHVTRDELRRYLDRTEIGNGFGNRFVWLCVKRSKVLPEGGRIDEVDFAPVLRRLSQAIDHARRGAEMERDEAARRVWFRVYEGLSEGKPGLLGAMIGRAEAQVMRLACLYALLDMSYVVRAEHMNAALGLWDYAEASARFIFGDSLGDPDADAIMAALRGNPAGLTRSDISRGLFGRNKPAQSIGRALGLLLELGKVSRVSEETEGRAAERWFAVTRVTT